MSLIARLQFGDNSFRRYSHEYLVTDFKCHVSRRHNQARPDGNPMCDHLELAVVVPGKDDFEQNTHNLYTISGENLGELTSVVLSHNSSGKDPGLCVDTVKITDQSTGEEYWANCRKISDGWIEKEKKLSVEYPLEKRK